MLSRKRRGGISPEQGGHTEKVNNSHPCKFVYPLPRDKDYGRVAGRQWAPGPRLFRLPRKKNKKKLTGVIDVWRVETSPFSPFSFRNPKADVQTYPIGLDLFSIGRSSRSSLFNLAPSLWSVLSSGGAFGISCFSLVCSRRFESSSGIESTCTQETLPGVCPKGRGQGLRPHSSSNSYYLKPGIIMADATKDAKAPAGTSY